MVCIHGMYFGIYINIYIYIFNRIGSVGWQVSKRNRNNRQYTNNTPAIHQQLTNNNPTSETKQLPKKFTNRCYLPPVWASGFTSPALELKLAVVHPVILGPFRSKERWQTRQIQRWSATFHFWWASWVGEFWASHGLHLSPGSISQKKKRGCAETTTTYMFDLEGHPLVRCT